MKGVDMQKAFEEIIERLEDKSMMFATSKKFWDNPQNGEYVCNAVDIENAIKIVKEVASEYGGGWIPVEERLPSEEEYLKNDGRFIATDGNRVYESIFDISRLMFLKDYFGSMPVEDACAIAWQPLPELYNQKIEFKCANPPSAELITEVHKKLRKIEPELLEESEE